MTAEIRALLSVRTPWILLAAAQLVVVAGISGLMVSRTDTTSLAAQRDALAHAGLVSLFSLVLGILAVAGEYRHRTVTDTYLSQPRRERVILAKLGAQTLAGLVFGLVSAVVAVATCTAWLAAKGTGPDLTAAPLWHTLAGAVAGNALFAAIGVGVGALITNLIGAVAATLAWLALAEGIAAQLIGDAGRWLPFRLLPALDAVPAPGAPPQWAAALALIAYAAVLATAAVATTLRRDVT